MMEVNCSVHMVVGSTEFGDLYLLEVKIRVEMIFFVIRMPCVIELCLT